MQQAPQPTSNAQSDNRRNGHNNTKLLVASTSSASSGPSAGSIPTAPCQQHATDPLTGLPTHLQLNRELDTRLAQSRQNPVTATLALLQLANFYEIRSWVGRAEADLMLSDIARLLRDTLPDSVPLYRCQRYEFAVLLDNACSLNAKALIEQVSAAMLGATSDLIPPQLEMDCSVGLAQVHRSIPNAAVLFARARHNLQRSLTDHHEAEGAYGYLYQSPTRSIAIIKTALAKDQLELNYQAVVSLRHLTSACYEVRSGLNNSDAALPSHTLFDLATLNALGEALDRRVIEKALACLQAIRQPRTQLRVNIGLNSIVSADFLHWLGDALQHCPGCCEQIQIQVSEQDCLIAQHHLGDLSEGLCALGVRFGINHFGCMDDPLCYLPRLKVDFVKLDNSLTETIATDPVQETCLTDLTTRLHDRGLQVCAGGVESVRILPQLWQAGIDEVQGFALAAAAEQPDFPFFEERRVC